MDLHGRLSFKDIWTLGERASGVLDLQDDGLRGRVAGIVDAINAQGPFRPDQVEAIRAQAVNLLANRLRVAGDRMRFAGIAAEKIERPVFIIGFARSGTTLLHSLLAEDPEVLSPQSWHMFSPSPPPGVGPVAKGRIDYAHRRMQAWMDFAPAHPPMHPYVDKGAFQPIEDEEVFTLDFRNMYPFHWYRVPSARINVILAEGQAEAFRFHRHFLQHLQWNTGKTRWACKGPSGQHHLDAIFEVYPDALCIWPHRPIGDIYHSNVALRAATYDAMTGTPNDWVSQSTMIAEGMKAAYDRLLASDLIDDPRVMHVRFQDVSADPIGVVQQIYERQGLSVSDAFAGRMQAWLDDPENRVDRYGRRTYSYEQFGLDRTWIENLFADYSTRFGL